MTGVAPLHPFLQPLPNGHRAGPSLPAERIAVEGGTLLFAGSHIDMNEAARGIAAGSATDWRFDHDRRGAPVIRSNGAPPPFVSVSNGANVRALLLGTGPVGVDVESLERIEANAQPDDPWLAASETALIERMGKDDAVVELACRWVLREAYGKALGRGLDMPLHQLAFTKRAGCISLPEQFGASWRFALYRRSDIVIGIATAASDRQAIRATRQEAANAVG